MNMKSKLVFLTLCTIFCLGTPKAEATGLQVNITCQGKLCSTGYNVECNFVDENNRQSSISLTEQNQTHTFNTPQRLFTCRSVSPTYWFLGHNCNTPRTGTGIPPSISQINMALSGWDHTPQDSPWPRQAGPLCKITVK